MIELPKEKVKAGSQSPNSLLLYSLPKTGKTSVVAELPNALIIDLEKGANKVDALKIEANNLGELGQVVSAIKEANKAAGKFVYDYGVVDTATKLEEFADELAVQLFKKTPMGKSFTGDVMELKALPMGAGYGYTRKAYKILMNSIAEVFPKLILVGHTKDKIIEKNDKEVSSIEVDLTGKLAGIVTQKVDAIGYVYRKRNELHVSFKTDGDILNGNRSRHLSGKDIILSESDPETGKITAYWDRIYVD
jgi:hypothetical protein